MHRTPFLLPLLALSLLAQDPGSAERYRKDVAWLAGPETEGRGHASTGLEKAVSWLAERHRELGLLPQRQVFEAPGIRTAVRHDVRLGGQPLTWDSDISAPAGGKGQGQGLPLQWIGPDSDLGAPLTGKVAVLAEGTRKEGLLPSVKGLLKGHPSAVLVVTRAGSAEAARLGALQMPEGTLLLTMPEATFRKRLPQGAALLDKPTAPTSLGQMDVQVEHQTLPARLSNLWSVIPGRDPRLKDEYLVLLAHVDHLGSTGGAMSRAKTTQARSEVHPGADDNASGTAMVLELGRLLAAKPTRRSILLLHVSGEEQGLLGSAHWAKSPTIPLASVRFAFNFDMVGRMDPARPRLDIGTMGVRPEAVGRLDAHVPKDIPVNHDLGFYIIASDHASLAMAGVPSAFYTTGDHPDYHTPLDTADRIQTAAMSRVGGAALAAIREFGDADTLEAADARALEALNPAPPKAVKVSFGALAGDAEDPRGMVLEEVRSGSAAEAVGLAEGDVLASLDGEPIRTRYELTAFMSRHRPGDTITVTWFRGKDRREAKVVLR